MANVRLKLSPPWVTYINKVMALFESDPQITCTPIWDGPNPSITLACNNGDKVTALQQILASEVSYGNITLSIIIDGVPADRAFKTKKELFETAFDGNPVFEYAVCPSDEGYIWLPLTYVVFKNCVVQFFNDNLNDYHGMLSTLYETIADEVLTGPAVTDVYFNTDIAYAAVEKSPKNWP